MQKRSWVPGGLNQFAHKTLPIATGEDVQPEPSPNEGWKLAVLPPLMTFD